MTARRAVKSTMVQNVVGSLNGRAMIIGVDRLDYSKGLNLRLDAYDQFLRNFADWRGKVTYLQITPKSRSEIPEYVQMEQMVSQAAGRINGAYGEADWTPIRYVNRAYNRTALAGFYRGARAGLVTPLRDGMNLVAKEYIAAQDADDPGVLVLSRFAGAAHECREALLVNPYDTEQCATALRVALNMPPVEQRERMRSMRSLIQEFNVYRWAGRMLLDAARMRHRRRLASGVRRTSKVVDLRRA